MPVPIEPEPDPRGRPDYRSRRTRLKKITF
jgi:hypothetical protein